jgi:hypothetical protein
VHEGYQVVGPTHLPALLPSKYSWYAFVLETESFPGPHCRLKDYVNEKFQRNNLQPNPRPSVCSAMSQPVEIRGMVMNILLFPGIKATLRAIPSAEFQRHSVRCSNNTLQVFLPRIA